MCSAGKVLLTAISVISPGLRDARRAAAAIRSRTWAIFLAIDTKSRAFAELPSCARLDGRGRPSLRGSWRDGAEPRHHTSITRALHDCGWRRRIFWSASVGQRDQDHDNRQDDERDERQNHRHDALWDPLDQRYVMARSHQARDRQAAQRLACDQARGRQDAGVLYARLLGIVQATAITQVVGDPANHASDKNGKG